MSSAIVFLAVFAAWFLASMVMRAAADTLYGDDSERVDQKGRFTMLGHLSILFGFVGSLHFYFHGYPEGSGFEGHPQSSIAIAEVWSLYSLYAIWAIWGIFIMALTFQMSALSIIAKLIQPIPLLLVLPVASGYFYFDSFLRGSWLAIPLAALSTFLCMAAAESVADTG